MEQKTNTMKYLDRLGIPYTVHHYEGGALSGREVGQPRGKTPRKSSRPW